ncbi:VCBS domain-containing protein [Novosphingobium sp. Gsoil 351]|uniref:beta strand repeat-containing protein n=1 Tax=Novosphingobium sp. Gsoil 351 TaxID=2675225 RepID=UPI001E47CC8C|nr:VCBS domain-containing protein [Novosphingobium sp. Gsoil 351]
MASSCCPYARGESTALAGATLQGQYGTLTIAANGTYSYTRNAGTPGGVSDSFAYTVRDGDGDLATANLVITITDSGTTLTLPVAGTPGSTQVLEAGLPAGSAAAGDGEFASGTFTFTAPDGPATVTIGNTVVTTVGQTIPGSLGTLTITSIASGSIGYTYQLTTNTSGDNTSDAFAVTVADKDNDSSTGTLTIAIVDDVPSARADVDSVKEDGPTLATGNVVTAVDRVEGDANTTDGVADTKGADGAIVTAVAFVASGDTIVSGTVGTGLAGAYGTLTLAADGSYSYALNNANAAVQGLDDGETLTETFRYTLTDGDGDPSTTTLTITINGTNDAPVVGTGAATVSEEGLAGANADAVGNTDTTDSATSGGTISITDADGEPATVTLGNPGAVLTSGGATVTWSGIGTGTLTGSVGETAVIRIAIDNTGAYTVTLLGPVDQATANVEDTKTFVVPVSVSDGTATVPTTLTVTIEDDSPLAANDTDAVTEDGPTTASGNVLTGVGSDGNAAGADSIGADGPAAGGAVVAIAGGTIGSALAGTYGSITLNANGSYTYTLNNSLAAVQGLDGDDKLTESFTYTIRDRDGDTATATLTVTINGANDPVTITGLNTEGGEQTVFEANLSDGSNPSVGALTKAGSFTTAGIDGIATIVVGTKTVFTGGAFVSGQTIVTAQGTLTITGVTPVKDAAGDTVSATVAYSYTLNDNTLAHNAAGNDAIFDSFAVTVTDSDGSVATDSLDVKVVDDLPLAVADGPFTVSEQTALVIDAFANDTTGADGVILSTGIALTTGAAKGTVAYNGNGTFTYTPNAGAEGADSFTYTITDRDGDSSTATVTLNLLADSVPMVKSTTNLMVDEDGFPLHNPDGSALVHPAETAGSNSLTDTTGSAVVNFGADTPTPANLAGSIVLVDLPAYDTQLKTLSGQPVVFAIEGTALVGRETNAMGVEVIRIALTGATVGPLAGDVTYTYSTTLSQPVQHTATGEDTAMLMGVTFQVTDSDTDTMTGRFNVAILDDVPAINVTQNAESGVTLITQDAETIGLLTDTAVSTAKFGNVFTLASVAGSDGAASAPTLSYGPRGDQLCFGSDQRRGRDYPGYAGRRDRRLGWRHPGVQRRCGRQRRCDA